MFLEIFSEGGSLFYGVAAINRRMSVPTKAPTDSSGGWPAGNARFATTQWSVVLAVGGEGPERDAALERFCGAYWYPVYAFIRRRGANAEDARDLTQEFFAQLIEKGWLHGVERRDTRFSTLLLTILQRFQVDEYRRANREKRGGATTIVSLDMAQAEAWFGAEPTDGETPERTFERRWALAVMDAGLARRCEDCRATGRAKLYATLSPFLSRQPSPGEYEAAGELLGLKQRAVIVAVHRLRAEFREMVREEVAAGMTEKSRIDEEMEHLARAL